MSRTEIFLKDLPLSIARAAVLIVPFSINHSATDSRNYQLTAIESRLGSYPVAVG